MAAVTVDTLKGLRCDEGFVSFWRTVIEKQRSVDVNEPALPRRSKAPCRYEIGTSSSHFPASIEDHYRPIYFEAIDTLVQCITQRFDQPGFKVYSNLETLLLKGAKGCNYDTELSSVQNLYQSDFDMHLLKTQLLLLKSHFEKNPNDPTLMDVVAYLRSLNTSSTFMSEVVKLVILILVAPATNATSERSFSALRRVKTYLRTTMSQQRLNHLMVLHIHKEDCDKLNLEQCADDFCANSEHRRSIFGSFI